MAIAGQRVVVLGAGITGLTAAWALSNANPSSIVLLEKGPAVGGLAATFRKDSFSFDTGSHRLHEECDPETLALIKDLCGPDLLRRERRGLIHLQGKALPYPPSALDVLFGFGLNDARRFIGDFVRARLHPRAGAVVEPSEDFESFVVSKLGRSLYERFYRPYAVKLYGTSPRTIAKDAAANRVRKFTLSGIYADLKRKLRRRRPEYLYPAHGIGQLAGTLQTRFTNNGGTLLFISRINKFQIANDRVIHAVDVTTNDGRDVTLEADVVISTIPLDVLHHLVALESENGNRPSFNLQWRGLRVLYLITPDKIPSDRETFYFPESDVVFGRVSELNKYSPFLNPDSGRAALAIEIPCTYGDEIWNAPDNCLAERCTKELQRMHVLRTPASGAMDCFSRKLRAVYPVYDLGWRARFDKIYQRLRSVTNLYVIGRTALFLHCNIDHCMTMALELAKYLKADHESRNEWDRIEKDFFEYRVRE
jgi:protoporphyrinogen oxidase